MRNHNPETTVYPGSRPKAPQYLSVVRRRVGGKRRGGEEAGLSAESPETPVSPRDWFYPENFIYT